MATTEWEAGQEVTDAFLMGTRAGMETAAVAGPGRAQRQRLQAEFWGLPACLRFHSGHSWADGQVSKTGLGVLPVLGASPPLPSVLGRQTHSAALQPELVPWPVEGAQKVLQACL